LSKKIVKKYQKIINSLTFLKNSLKVGIRKRAKHPAKRSGMETLKVLFATLFGLAKPSGKEERTIAAITDFLKEQGVFGHIQVVEVLGAGVILVSKIDPSRPTIIWRADIDALPTPDGGCTHLCGHHAHTAIGAQLLLEHARAVANGTVGEKTPNLVLVLERAEERPDLNRVDDLATEIKKIVDPATSQIVAIHTAYLPPMPNGTPRPPRVLHRQVPLPKHHRRTLQRHAGRARRTHRAWSGW